MPRLCVHPKQICEHCGKMMVEKPYFVEVTKAEFDKAQRKREQERIRYEIRAAKRQQERKEKEARQVGQIKPELG